MNKTHHAENSNVMTDAVDALRSASKEIVDGTVHGYEAISDTTRTIAKKTDRYVRHNPWVAVGAGFGVGLLLGLCIRRDRS